MIYVTKRQRENALEALNVMWPSVPAKNVVLGLKWWRVGRGTEKPTCKTICCFDGWCAWWPNFKKQGVYASSSGYPGTSDFLFGVYGLSWGRGNWGETDTGFKGTDHELVTHRLKWLIKNSEVV
jgi:hypothetical protein